MDIKKIENVVTTKTEEDFLLEAFDMLITKGNISKEIDISGLKLTIEPLSTSAYLEAETVYIANIPDVPSDVISRVRSVSSLVHAVRAVNGRPVPSEKEEAKKFRDSLYKQFMKLPPALIDNMAAKYREMVNEQTKIYDDITAVTTNF